MITTKIKKLQQMANFEGDVRDGNIGSFSQGVVVGERNASRLAFEVLEEITKRNLIFIDRKGNEEYIERMENLRKSQDIAPPLENDKPKPLSWKPDSTKSIG
jgi:hypothetical protein